MSLKDNLKISVITVVYNGAATIANCIQSVTDQNYSNIEHIVIDGGSTDGTLAILDQHKESISKIVSEPDKGIYDAMNKELALATGHIIGTLNVDDRLAANDVFSDVAALFAAEDADIVYGDLVFVNQNNKVVRKWISGRYYHGIYNWGWMSRHPTFYYKRVLFEKWGGYSLSYGSAADYELMLRFMHAHKPKVAYLHRVMVKMLPGGVSNKSVGGYLKAWRNDLKAMQKCGIKWPMFATFLKPIRKTLQVLKK